MSLLRVLLIAAVCYQNVECGKKHFCSFEDTKCLTKSAGKAFKESVYGHRDGAPHSDPINVDIIETNLPTLKYTTHNNIFRGMRSCDPELVQINLKDSTYIYQLGCKNLSLEGLYEAKGKVGSMDIDEQGEFKADFDDYVVKFTGEFELTFEDKKQHILIKSSKLETTAKGKVVYEFKNSAGASEKSTMQKITKDNSKEVDNILQKPIMEKMMVIFIKNVNDYLKIVPIIDLFYIED